MREANINVYNNTWDKVNEDSGDLNYSLIYSDDMIDCSKYIPLPPGEVLSKFEVNFAREKSFIPFTYGSHCKTADNVSCLVIMFNDGLQYDRCSSFIRKMREKYVSNFNF